MKLYLAYTEGTCFIHANLESGWLTIVNLMM